MSTLTIWNDWRSVFGTVLPAGHLCRAELPDYWMRIHSLPESKRYPESDQEYKELLARQNSVAEYTLGEGSECVLFFTRLGDSKNFTSMTLPLNGLVPEHVMSLYDEEGEDEYQFFALQISWHKDKFNDLIVACANDQTGPILFANLASRTIYAPYDGGADLFFRATEDVYPARTRFASWISERSDGL